MVSERAWAFATEEMGAEGSKSVTNDASHVSKEYFYSCEHSQCNKPGLGFRAGTSSQKKGKIKDDRLKITVLLGAVLSELCKLFMAWTPANSETVLELPLL